MWNGEKGAGCSSAMAKDGSGNRKRSHDESDDPISIQEVVAIDQYFEDEARALLGTANESVCTYPEGYTPRQMVYACKTCTSPSEPAAICYGCSIHCHEEHDLVELYTKRKVCCDCGNSKFKNRCTLFPAVRRTMRSQFTATVGETRECLIGEDNRCRTIHKEKVPLNERNQYNHNYSGLYCVCNRPYPAPECDDDDEEMVQCVICEDWFHTNHLEWAANFGESENDEVVCGKCASSIDFLKYYADNNYEEVQDINVCKLKALMHRYTMKEECSLHVQNVLCEEKEQELCNRRKKAPKSESPSALHGIDEEMEEGEVLKSEQLDCKGPDKRKKAYKSVGEREQYGRTTLETDRGLTSEVSEGRSCSVVGKQVEGTDLANRKKENEKSESADSFGRAKENHKAKHENEGTNVRNESEHVKRKVDEDQSYCSDERTDEKHISGGDHGTNSDDCKDSLGVCGQSVEKLSVLLFNSTTWRERLCRCQDCLATVISDGPFATLPSRRAERQETRPLSNCPPTPTTQPSVNTNMYEEKEVGFLLDPEDTLANYTKNRYTDRPSEEVEKKRVIDGLVNVAGRDVALCVLEGYERMKSKVMEMLARKSAEDSTVTEEDIAKTFSELRAEMKRPRLE